jgi:hypothetical protein
VAIVTGILIFNQMDANKTSLAHVSYLVGSGWYLCLAGSIICLIASMVRLPSKLPQQRQETSPS